MSVVEAIGVGHSLQEDVHLVEDGGQSGVTPIISHNLHRNVKNMIFSVQQVSG